MIWSDPGRPAAWPHYSERSMVRNRRLKPYYWLARREAGMMYRIGRLAAWLVLLALVCLILGLSW